MKLAIVFSCFLPSVLSTAFGTKSAVITSKDVREGITTSKMNLTPGENYRVYAVYASSATNGAYARNVIIQGADKTKFFSVYDLAAPKRNTEYFLDESINLTAPITITNNNPASTASVPFTIYIVNTILPVAPVISAQLINGQVDSSLAKMSSPSCTVLSAEMDFQLSGMTKSSALVPTGYPTGVAVQTVGFDSTEKKYEVLTAENAESTVMISGPIATLYNPDAAPANFNFAIRKDGEWNGYLTPGARTTFLSNGWLTDAESYNVDYENDNVLSRRVDFGKLTYVYEIDFPGEWKQEDGIRGVSCVEENGDSYVYHPPEAYCTAVSLKVAPKDKDTRFRVHIYSASFATSVWVLLIATFIGRLLH